MQSRPTMIRQMTQFLKEGKNPKDMLAWLSLPENAGIDNYELLLLETITAIENELTPEEILSHLNRKDDNGSTVAMRLAKLFKAGEDCKLAKQTYISLLTNLIARGLPAQSIADHLFQENYRCETIAHFLRSDAILELLTLLEKNNTPKLALNHFLAKKNNAGTSVYSRFSKDIKSCEIPDDRIKLIYYVLTNLPADIDNIIHVSALLPLLNHIDKLTEEEKKRIEPLLNPKQGEESALQQYIARTAALLVRDSSEPVENLIALLTSASLPHSIKIDCLKAFEIASELSADKIIPLLTLLHENKIPDEEVQAFLKKKNASGVALINQINELSKKNPALLYRLIDNNLLPSKIGVDSGILIPLLNHLENLSLKQENGVLLPFDNSGRTIDLYQYVEKSALFITKNANIAEDLSPLISLLRPILPDAISLLCLREAKIPFLKNANDLESLMDVIIRLAEKKEYTKDITALLLKHWANNESILNKYLKHGANRSRVDKAIHLLETLQANGTSHNDIIHILCFHGGIWSFQNLPAINAVIDVANKDAAFLYRILTQNMLPAVFMPEVQKQKNNLFAYMKTLLPVEKIKAFISSTMPQDPPSSLYQFMHVQRGLRAPTLAHGVLKNIEDELEDGILRKKDSLLPGIKAFMQTNDVHQQDKMLLQSKLVALSSKNPAVLVTLLNHHLLPETTFSEFNAKQVRRYILGLPEIKRRSRLLDAYVPSDAPLHVFMQKHRMMRYLSHDLSQVGVNTSMIQPNELANPVPAPPTVIAKEKPVMSEEELANRKATAYHMPALYKNIYGEAPPKEWLAPQPVANQQPMIDNDPPPAYDANPQENVPMAPPIDELDEAEKLDFPRVPEGPLVKKQQQVRVPAYAQ